MKVNVNVSKETLGWIMANINFDALSSQIAGRLMSWYSGEKVPTFNQIEEASRTTGIPLGYFFLNTRPTHMSAPECPLRVPWCVYVCVCVCVAMR